MKKLFLLAFVVLFGTSAAIAQNSYATVTATVSDPSGNPLAGAMLTATLVNSAGQQIQMPVKLSDGTLYNGSPTRAFLDPVGHFSVSIPTNPSVSSPANSQWSFVITAPTGPSIVVYPAAWNITYATSISGGTDLSAAMSAQLTGPVSFMNPQTGQAAFLSLTTAAESILPSTVANLPAATTANRYFRRTVSDGISATDCTVGGGTTAVPCWNPTGSGWSVFGGSGTGNAITALTGDGSAAGPGSAAFTLAASGVSAGSYTNTNITVDAKGRVTAAANGTGGGTSATFAPIAATFYGDSITSGTGITTAANLYVNRIANYLSAAATNYAISGSQACDIAPAEVLIHDVPAFTAQQPWRSLLVSTNDANVKGSGAYEATFNLCHLGVSSYLTTPSGNVVTGGTVFGNGTFTGTCASDTTYSQLTGIRCTANASTATFTVTTTGGPLYIWPRITDGDAGTWTYNVDGAGAVAQTTATTTPIATFNSTTSSMGFIRVPVAAGAHTIVFTETNGSGSMGILGIGTPASITASASLPFLVVGDTPPQIGTGGGASTCAANVTAYRADIAANVALLKADGQQIFPALIENYLQASTAAGDMFTSGASTCAAGGSNYVHPNDAGSGEVAAAMLSAIKLMPGQGTPPGAKTLGLNGANYVSPHTVTSADGSFLISAGTTGMTIPAGLPVGTAWYAYNNSTTPVTITNLTGSGKVLAALDGQTGAFFSIPITNYPVETESPSACGVLNKNASYSITLLDCNIYFSGTALTATFTAATLGVTVGNSPRYYIANYSTTSPLTVAGVNNLSILPPGNGATVSCFSTSFCFATSTNIGAYVLSIPAGTATFSAGTNVTSCGCASTFTCTNTRGRLTIVGGTATTGTICTVNFSGTLAAAPFATLNEMGATALHGLDHGLPTTTAFTITAASTVTGATMTVDYSAQP